MAISTLVDEILFTVKSTPMYQIPTPKTFSFKPDNWPQWKRRFERSCQSSGLQLQEEQI